MEGRPCPPLRAFITFLKGVTLLTIRCSIRRVWLDAAHGIFEEPKRTPDQGLPQVGWS